MNDIDTSHTDPRYDIGGDGNLIAECEMRLHEILQEEIARRPELDITGLLTTHSTQKRIVPILAALETFLRRKFVMRAKELKDRYVMVVIEERMDENI